MNSIPDKFIYNKANDFANLFVDSLLKGKTDFCLSLFGEDVNSDEAKIFLDTLYKVLMDKDIDNSTLISSKKTIIAGDDRFFIYQLGFEYQFQNLWTYFYFDIYEKNDVLSINHVNTEFSDISLSNVHSFTNSNKSLRHFLWLDLAIIMFIFSIVTLIIAIIQPIKYKWLWIIFILISVANFKINWTTGDYEILPIAIKILGASFSKQGIIAPWIISFGIPLGAIVFWIVRKKITKPKLIEIHKY